MLAVRCSRPSTHTLNLDHGSIDLSLLATAKNVPVNSFCRNVRGGGVCLGYLSRGKRPVRSLNGTRIFSSLPSLGKLLGRRAVIGLGTNALSGRSLIRDVVKDAPLGRVDGRVSVQ